MGARDVDACMRMLARHQWVREHGTPRVTTLVGRVSTSRALWSQWLTVTRRGRSRRAVLEQPPRATTAWLDTAAARASSMATATPREAVALLVEAELFHRWLGGRDDRAAALLAEGLVEVPARGVAPAAAARASGARARRAPAALAGSRARSLAELTLHDALEATAATAGRFQLNQSLAFSFGSRGAEIDLLSRADAIAIEVDGFHHFGDAEHYRRDRHKDLLLQAHGYVVLRFLADDVLADPRAVVQSVVELLGNRLRHDRLARKD
jgi:very-short-patch-repair endonuclease